MKPTMGYFQILAGRGGLWSKVSSMLLCPYNLHTCSLITFGYCKDSRRHGVSRTYWLFKHYLSNAPALLPPLQHGVVTRQTLEAMGCPPEALHCLPSEKLYASLTHLPCQTRLDLFFRVTNRPLTPREWLLPLHGKQGHAEEPQTTHLLGLPMPVT